MVKVLYKKIKQKIIIIISKKKNNYPEKVTLLESDNPRK